MGGESGYSAMWTFRLQMAKWWLLWGRRGREKPLYCMDWVVSDAYPKVGVNLMGFKYQVCQNEKCVST
ncbi:hypothetical protein HMPREF2752_06285 [Corynebacterium sp. HMSC077C02]|nr:hypothetical protein HMPREF2752_06285 [Corynebacterium sp. HMSC077C02]